MGIQMYASERGKKMKKDEIEEVEENKEEIKEEKGRLSFDEVLFLSIGALGLFLCIGFAAIGTWVHYEEQERIANLSPVEYAAYEESIAQEESKRVEAQAENARLDQAFNEEMKRYESDSITYLGGARDSYAKFLLKDVALGETYVFGEHFPAGKQASLNMSGRGSAASGRKGQQADWNKAGTYGIYHYESRDVRNAVTGDYLEFNNLSQVEIRIMLH